MTKFSERLKELRIEKGYTCIQLEKELGFGNSCVGKWEKCERVPSIDVLYLLARFFNVSADYLLGLED